MGPTEPVTVALDESRSCAADQIGHLQGRPGHLSAFQHQRVQRTGDRVQVPLRKMQIAGGLFQIVMA